MFFKREKTRRLVCRAGFFWLCAVPTCAVVAWCVFLYSPQHRTALKVAWQSRLENLLGVTVLVDKLSFPTYDSVRFEGVSLVDPETSAPLAQIRSIAATKSARSWSVVATYAEIPSAHTSQIREVLEQRILRRLRSDATPVDVQAAQLTVKNSQSATTFRDFRLKIEPVPQGARATLEFCIAGLTMALPAELKITRQRTAEATSTVYDFDTHETWLPCATFFDVVPELARLGPQSRFYGLLSYTESAGRWDASVSGKLDDVELDKLTSGLPHKLSGRAKIELDRFNIEQGQLVHAAGWLTAEDGAINRHLLESLVRDDTLRMQLVRSVSDRFIWPYEKLSLGFKINAHELDVKGRCPPSESRAIIVDRNGVLLRDSDSPSVPVVALIRALVPANEVQVPASQQTRALLSLLPLPPFQSRLDEKGLYTPVDMAERPRIRSKATEPK